MKQNGKLTAGEIRFLERLYFRPEHRKCWTFDGEHRHAIAETLEALDLIQPVFTGTNSVKWRLTMLGREYAKRLHQGGAISPAPKTNTPYYLLRTA